jgi:hypothetical protein
MTLSPYDDASPISIGISFCLIFSIFVISLVLGLGLCVTPTRYEK